jgi:ubiquinone/menaquinone biosynthesis C-methylase UbiE
MGFLPFVEVSGFGALWRLPEMQFHSLNSLPIDADSKELEALCAPFSMKEISGRDIQWDVALAKRRGKVAWRYLKQRLFGWMPDRQRTESNIKAQYADNWGNFDFSSYDPTLKKPPINMWKWGRRRMFARVRMGARLRQYLLIKVLEELRPRRVLEVGSGNGINLLLLSCRFPDVEFHGVELTEEGVNAARSLQARTRLPENLKAFAPFSLRSGEAYKRVQFRQGSAAALPFADGSFDLVYTCVAVEQMERIRDTALSEIARVSTGHTFFYEPFYDVNSKGLARRYIVARDYFQGKIDDLIQYGLQPIWATNDLPQKVNNNVCAVLCAKHNVSASSEITLAAA